MTLPWNDIILADPWYLLLLLALPLYLIFRRRLLRQRWAVFRISHVGETVGKGGRARWMPLLEVLRWTALVAIVIALARPQSGYRNQRVSTAGIDIVLALDISSSMYAIDFKPNRIAAAKEAAKDFIDARPQDRIGLVVFAGEFIIL